ncbi:MAG: hypothetical protein OEV44_10395, partial [Spirochaetota bacterium]|nr:hypothetical protein [Spirochaetota bacterium]
MHTQTKEKTIWRSGLSLSEAMTIVVYFHFSKYRTFKDYYINGRLRCYYLVEPMILDILDTLNKEYSKDLTPP